MVLRPGGTYDISPAIYRRVLYYTGLRPGGTPENRRSCVKAEGPPSPAHHIDITGVVVVLSGDRVRDRLRHRRSPRNRFSHRNFNRPSGTQPPSQRALNC
jgi:hypothetical protein